MRSQGVTEELKCLSLLNALDKDQDIPDQLAQLFGEPCIKLAEGIKAYISKVQGSSVCARVCARARLCVTLGWGTDGRGAGSVIKGSAQLQ